MEIFIKIREINEEIKTLSKQIVNATTEKERETLKQKCEVLTAERNRLYQEKEVKWFENMKPFNGNIDAIPLLPILSKEVYDSVIVPNLVRCGAIPKKDLEVGKTYKGSCRNASEAVWNGKVFIYERYKFGATYPEKINHFEDDDGCDLFVPIALKNLDS